LAQLNGIVVLVLSLLPVAVFVMYAKKKISGMTGDTIGATSEIAEAAVLFFTLVYLRR
jgi:adenosylcobinamide-GDP ribazoletransferase